MVGSQWERFKQSNVARIFIAYAVVAFGLMQVFDYLLPINMSFCRDKECA